MVTSSFQQKVEGQFDYYCKLIIKYERKSYIREIMRRAEKEVSFSTVGEVIENKLVDHDTLPSDFQLFYLYNQPIDIENALLYKALRNLPEKKRKIILLYYFWDYTDLKIASLLQLHTSTVNRSRNDGLLLLRKYMEAYKNEA
jgi:DNA-directed RNA polymerase specialized sigma24 family protein